MRRFLALSLIAVGLCASASAQVYVSNLAGQLSPGNTEGTGAGAQFRGPFGVAFDSTNNLIYVADQGNNSIRKIAAGGLVSTFASGLGGPSGVAVDTAGNVYVADTNNHVIRKYTSAGTASTVWGQVGVFGNTDTAGGTPSFSGPHGVVVDGAGTNLYVADSGNGSIRKIVIGTGVVTTFATGFSGPYGLALDGAGNVYVADTGNHVIRKVTAGGVVSVLAGTAGTPGSLDGTGTGASFHSPYGIAVDSTATNLYVADTLNHVIRQIVIATGAVTTLVGSAGSPGSANGIGSNARFNGPAGVAASAAGPVYVADFLNNLIRQGALVVAPGIGGGGQPANRTVTAGATNVTFTVTATGFPTLSYQWQRQAGGIGSFASLANDATYSGATSATLTIATATAGMNGDVFQCIVTNPPAAGTITSSTASLTVNSAPGITSAAGATFVVSTAGTFTVTGSGFPAPTFVASGAAFPSGWPLTLNATTGVLSGTPPLGTANTSYTFTITASNGIGTAATQSFTLSVVPTVGVPVISSQTGNQTVVAGATNVTFGVAAIANPAISAYRWYRVAAVTSVLTDLTTDVSGSYSGTNTAFLTIIAATAAMNQDKYYCAVTNANGTTNSTQSILAVNSAPAFSSAGTTTFVVSSAGTFTVTASGYPAPTFVASGAGFPAGWPLSLNANTGVLSGTPPLGADTTSPYSFTITASNGIGTAATQSFVLYVVPASGIPQINTQPANQTVAVGLNATFAVTASANPAANYLWYRQAANTTGFFSLADGGAYSGTTTASLVVTGVTNAMSGDKFQCVVSNGYGSSTTNPASLTVPAAPAITSANTTTFTVIQPGTFTVTATGGPVPTFSISGAGFPSGWPLTLNPTTGVLSGTPPLGADTSSPYTFTIIATNANGTASQPFTLNVQATPSIPIITTQPTSQAVLAGQNATFTVVAAGSPAPAYQWQRQPSGTSTWSNLTDDAVYSGTTTATLVVTGVTTFMSGDQFQCVVSNSNGSVTSTPVSLTLNLGSAFTTIAGLAGSTGSIDGTGTAARLYGPTGVTVDSAGNIFVTDGSNNTIREITPAGVVTTIAGVAGSRGSTNGLINAARFNQPTGIAVDTDGNLYVADTGNNIIRKLINSGGVYYTTTLAGTAGVSGSGDGIGAAAQFNHPYGLAINSGNLYVADTQNSTIRLVTSTGAVSTLAGLAGNYGNVDGTGSAARFSFPYGVAVDSAGTLYVADSLNDTIRKVTLGGSVTTFAGQAGIGGSRDDTGLLAKFNQPCGIVVDSTGNVFVSDTSNNTVREITPAGVVTTLAGLAGSAGSADGSGSAVRFNRPFGIAVDSSGNVIVADSSNNTIRATGVGAVSAPQIQTQSANQTKTVGQSATFTVAATGVPAPSYQWQRQAAGTSTFVNLTDAGAYSGTATATLTVNITSAAMNGDQFQCIVGNGVSPNAISSAALLTLNLYSAPAFTTSPVSQTAVVGGTVNLTAAASGNPAPAYQWRINGANIPSATSATLTLSNVQLTDAGDYDVVATNQSGNATSSLAQLAVVAASSAPVITLQPASQTVVLGGSVNLNALAVAFPAATYQWRLNGANIGGATNATLTLTNVQAASAGQYDVVISNSLGSVVATAATLRVLSHSYAGVYFGSYGPGLGSFALYIRADNTGVGLFSKLPGATNAFAIYNLTVSDTGVFTFVSPTTASDHLVAADQPGAASSGPVAAAVGSNFTGSIGLDGSVTGTIIGAPGASLSGTRAPDTGATQAVVGYFQASAPLNSATTLVIAGAAGQIFALTRTATTADAGLGTVNAAGVFTVTTTNQGSITGAVAAATGQMTASAATSQGQITTFTGASEGVLATQRLSSISTRARVGLGDSVVIAGFIITGQESKSVLIRAVGPTLANFAVSGTVAAPKLDLYRIGTSAPIATNTGWTTSGNTAAITAAAARSGAFALGANSADSAILTTLAPGTYTAMMSSANNTPGIGLVEVYDLSTPLVGQRMVDISTRAAVGTGDNVLIAGVYVAGSVPKRVLIRAIGPGLAPYLSGGLALPQLALFRGTQATPVAQNAGWSVSPDANAIAAASAQVAGLALTTGDAAMIVSLDPGVAYTAQVTGANGSSGIGLVEIYELP
jgi:DNA-binding beta-propeller fold protein YncE